MSFLTDIRQFLVDKEVLNPLDIKEEVRKKEFGKVRDIYSARDGVYKSEIEEVRNIFTGGLNSLEEFKEADSDFLKSGVHQSDVGSVKKIVSVGYGVNQSEVGSVEEIYSKDSGIYKSDLRKIGVISSENKGINNSKVGNIDEINSERDGIYSSIVGEVGSLNSESQGINNSEVGKVGEIESEFVGVTNSKVEKIGKILSQATGIENSKIKEVDSIFAETVGVRNSSVESIGSIFSIGIGISNSSVSIVGDIRSGKGGVYRSNNINVFGNIEKKYNNTRTWSAFMESHNVYNVGTKIEGDILDHKTYGGLVATKNLDVKEYNRGLTVLTNNKKGGTCTFTGDWDKLQKVLKEDTDTLKNMKLFPVLDRNFGSLEELLEFNEEIGSYFETQLEPEDTSKNIKYIKPFLWLNEKHLAQMVESTTKGYEKKAKKRLQRFGYNLSFMNGNNIREVLNDLETGKKEHKVGKDLYEIGKNMDYIDFINTETLERFVSERKDFLQILEDLEEDIEFFEEDSPYKELAEDLVLENAEDLTKIYSRAEKAGINPSFKALKKLKGLEGQRKNTGFSKDIEQEYIESLMEQDIENKTREYTKQALGNLGLDKVESLYFQITGKESEMSQKDIKLLKAYQRFEKNRESTEKLLVYGDSVYGLQENQRWLEEKGFEESRLTGFETEFIELGYDEQKIRDEKELVLNEMNHLLQRYSEETGREFEAESFEDFLKIKESEKPPSDSNAQFLYRRIFKEKLNEYKGIEKRIDSIPEKVKVRTATPLESVEMGDHFANSCFAISKSNGWGAIGNAVDINKQVLYAVDEDDKVLGRMLTAVTDNNKLSFYNHYKNVEGDLKPVFEHAVERYGQHLGLETAENEREVSTLESDVWYRQMYN